MSQIQESDGCRMRSAAPFFLVDDVFATAELRAKKADIVEGPVDRIYNMRELLVRDCNGYVLAFGQG